jgi:hypothetical protein
MEHPIRIAPTTIVFPPAPEKSLEEILNIPDPVDQINELIVFISANKEVTSYAEFKLKYIKEVQVKNTIIKWRDEIRACLGIDDDTEDELYTATDIARCVAIRHGLDVTSDMKNKISTTLSIMHRSGDIGRIQQESGKSYYGVVRLFDETLKNLKPEYQELVPR